MNLIAVTLSLVALLGSATANILFTAPVAGSFWYTNVPNTMTITSDNSLETSATVRFTGCNECFSLTVLTNSTVPVVLPRSFRLVTGLNLYAVSNSLNTATTFVNVVNSMLPVTSCYASPVGTNCAPCAAPCASRRRGCGYYADDASQVQHEACQSELKYIDYDSEAAKSLLAQQEQAAADLAADLAAAESASASH